MHVITHRAVSHSRFRIGGLGLAVALFALVLVPAASQAACGNPIQCENQLPGTPESVWEVDGSGDPTILGFATSMSVNKGDPVSFKIKSATSNYKIDILRLGYYGGDGARMIASGLTPTNTTAQPACPTAASTGMTDCGNWSVSRSWTVPSTAVSGVYIALLTRNDTGGQSQIPFVVRDDSSHSDLVVQTSDETWQAYNTYGGNSLYTCTTVCPPGNPKAYQGALKVSYNRPLSSGDAGPSSLFSGAEYNMIRFLEASGYDASYISGVDTSTRGSLLLNHKLFMSSGHDEYWSGDQRANVTAARDAGVNLAFFSGNEVFWKTRFEPSTDGSNTPNRTLVSYKDTHFDNPAERDPVTWTGTWRDTRFTTPSVNTPENALTGTSFVVNSGTSAITVPYAYRQLRMWRNTAVASLTSGQSRTLAPDTLGYEWDEDPDNGYRPPGAIKLSSTTVSGIERFTDYGSTTAFNQTATHNLVMYKAPSGARVFGAGTVQWAWGLDDYGEHTADPTMQQATVNLFADMGAQPTTPLSGLVGASKTTDTTAPTATLTSPPSAVTDGSQVTLSGTAADTGGGVVAGVEVSTDNGSTWHPASGTTSWTYSWTAHGSPSTTIKVRASDDSGNLGAASAGASVTVNCPCTIFGNSLTPPTADGGDPSPVEVGVKFKSDRFGMITGLRFYKASTNTGTHIGSLWTADGQRLTQATFSGESASGWQTVTFPSPVQVMPDTTYVASYFAPNGHYSATQEYFYPGPAPGPNGGGTQDSPPLHAIRNQGTTGNGVYAYASNSTFPNNSYGAANYWVDVRWSPIDAPGTVTGVSAVEGGRTSANVSWTAPSSGGAPTSYKITPYIGSTAQPATTVSGTPPATSKTVTGLTSGSTYRFTVQAINPTGSGPASAQSNAVTPLNPVVPAKPTNVSATGATQSAKVNWTAPASDGDSAITGYTVTPYIGSTAQASVQAAASATSTTVTGLTNGTAYTFRVTAGNGVGNSPASDASNVATPAATIFDFSAPSSDDAGDPNGVEVGVKFTADLDGSITGIRFYKAAANTGTHTGSLWSASGQRLAQVTFTGESASGWQTATFSSPVAVTHGVTYVASYYAPLGHYSATSGGLSSPVDNAPLHALGNSADANGVYAYGAASSFPSNTWGAANYWVDVMYAMPKPGQVTGATASEGGSTSAKVSWTAPSNGGPVSSYRITPYVGSTPSAPITVSGSPPATSKTVGGLTTGTTYRFTVEAVNANGAGPASAFTNSVTPAAPVVPSSPGNVFAQPATKSVRVSWTPSDSNGDSAITGQTVTPYIGGVAQTAVNVDASATSTTLTGLKNGTTYTFKVTSTNAVGTSAPSAASNAVTPEATIFDFASPGTVDGGDGGAVEVGVKFRSNFAGAATGIRFYKASTNTGNHIGSLWTTGGTRLATAVFSNESSSGWQSATFSTPVTLTPGTIYVASYYAPNGHYSVTGNGFASNTLNDPLEALSNGTSSNGVYAYGSGGAFPSNTWGAANYWVDVLFDPAPVPGTVSSVVASAGQTSATINWSAPTSGGPVTSYDITPYIGSAAQTAKRKTVTGTPPTTGTTITGLDAGTSYTFTVRASNPTGDGDESAKSNAVVPLSAGTPGTPTGVSAQGDSKAAILSWTAPSDGGSAITSYTVTPYVNSAAQDPVVVNAPATGARVTGLTNGTGYTFRVAATNGAGTGAASAATSAVTPRSSIFESAAPSIVDGGDTSSVEIGVKFSSSVAGSITGLRFYKASTNTGSHVASLWSSTGTLLARGTVSNETSSGWQAVTFDTPVPITASTTYVASYLAPNGHYSVTPGAFSSAVTNPPLSALANSASANGVYRYSATPIFPTNDFNSTSYAVDVLFDQGP